MARANLGNLLSVASDQGNDESGAMAKKPGASVEAPKKPRQDKKPAARSPQGRQISSKARSDSSALDGLRAP